jgi:hypothetical protein
MTDYNESAVRRKLREAFARQPLGEPLMEDTRQTVRDAVERAVAADVLGSELRDLILGELTAGIGEHGSAEDIARVSHDVLAVFVDTFSPLILKNAISRRR